MKSNMRGEEAAMGSEGPKTLRGMGMLWHAAPEQEHPAAGSAPPSYGSKGSSGEGAQPEMGAGQRGKKSAEDEQLESVVRDAEKYVTD